LAEVTDIARRYIDRCDTNTIPATSFWQQSPANGLAIGLPESLSRAAE
jgi:hypothetical protein